MSYSVIDLSSAGESHISVNLEIGFIKLITRYNYSAECWCLDLFDADDIPLVTGVMLVPNVNILSPYPEVSDLIGSLMLVELNADDYKSPDLLGINTALLWFAPGMAVVYP